MFIASYSSSRPNTLQLITQFSISRTSSSSLVGRRIIVLTSPLSPTRSRRRKSTLVVQDQRGLSNRPGYLTQPGARASRPMHRRLLRDGISGASPRSRLEPEGLDTPSDLRDPVGVEGSNWPALIPRL